MLCITGVERAVLTSACVELRHRRRHHLQRAVEAKKWRTAEHQAQGEGEKD